MKGRNDCDKAVVYPLSVLVKTLTTARKNLCNMEVTDSAEVEVTVTDLTATVRRATVAELRVGTVTDHPPLEPSVTEPGKMSGSIA